MQTIVAGYKNPPMRQTLGRGLKSKGRGRAGGRLGMHDLEQKQDPRWGPMAPPFLKIRWAGGREQEVKPSQWVCGSAEER